MKRIPTQEKLYQQIASRVGEREADRLYLEAQRDAMIQLLLRDKGYAVPSEIYLADIGL